MSSFYYEYISHQTTHLCKKNTLLLETLSSLTQGNFSLLVSSPPCSLWFLSWLLFLLSGTQCSLFPAVASLTCFSWGWNDLCPMAIPALTCPQMSSSSSSLVLLCVLSHFIHSLIHSTKVYGVPTVCHHCPRCQRYIGDKTDTSSASMETIVSLVAPQSLLVTQDGHLRAPHSLHPTVTES